MAYLDVSQISERSESTWAASEKSLHAAMMSSDRSAKLSQPEDPFKSDNTPLLNSKQFLEQPGEQMWSTALTQGAHRTEVKNTRGVLNPRASGSAQVNWQSEMQTILGYHFHDVDLLEEALESEGSGVTCVGESHRHFLNGNTGLANVGGTVMKLVLREQCYHFQVALSKLSFRLRGQVPWSEKLTRSLEDVEHIVDQTIGRASIEKIGIKTKIQQFIRPRLGVRPSKKHNILALFKEDFKRAAAGADSSRQITKGVMAIVGAVHLDGGIDSAKRVMAHLGFMIKLPDGQNAVLAVEGGYSFQESGAGGVGS